MDKVVVIGAVTSTLRTLEGLLRHDLDVVGVLGLDPSKSETVSGYVDLGVYTRSNNIPFQDEIELNFSTFSKGLYYIILSSDKDIENHKILID